MVMVKEREREEDEGRGKYTAPSRRKEEDLSLPGAPLRHFFSSTCD